jgi:hypothetical protein
MYTTASIIPRIVAASPNQALQRTAFGIKCPAAGGRAPRAHERYRARVLRVHLAVAELARTYLKIAL